MKSITGATYVVSLCWLVRIKFKRVVISSTENGQKELHVHARVFRSIKSGTGPKPKPNPITPPLNLN